MTLRYNDFEIRGGQRLLLTFNEPDGSTTSMLWLVPAGWDATTAADDAFSLADLDDVGLMIGGQENIFPDGIWEASDIDQFTDRTQAIPVAAADIKIGDRLIGIDPFIADGADGPEYEVRFTVTEGNSDLPDDQYIWLAPFDVDLEEIQLYRA